MPQLSMEDFFWLVGLLEGEGSFMGPPPSSKYGSPRISLNMCDEDVVLRAATLMGPYAISRHVNKKHPDWNPTFNFKSTGKRATWLMIALYPYMGLRRQRAIKLALLDRPEISFLNTVQLEYALTMWENSIQRKSDVVSSN